MLGASLITSEYMDVPIEALFILTLQKSRMPEIPGVEG